MFTSKSRSKVTSLKALSLHDPCTARGLILSEIYQSQVQDAAKLYLYKTCHCVEQYSSSPIKKLELYNRGQLSQKNFKIN